MSNRINTAFAASGQPFQSPLHLDFLQNAPKLDIANLIIGMIGPDYSTSVMYRLWGAVRLPSGSDDYPNTAGAVFFNGEVYPVDAVGGFGTPMPDGIDLEVYLSASGTTMFADGTSHDINVSRKVRYKNNASPLYGDPVDVRFSTAFNGSTIGNALTVKNDKNNYYRIAAGSGAITITLDAANRATGTKSVVYVDADGSGNAVSFSTGDTTFIAGNNNALGGGDPFMIHIEYPGGGVYFITFTQYEY